MGLERLLPPSRPRPQQVEAPWLSDGERAEPMPDDVWEEAARHYDEQALAGLAIAGINVWNRVNVTTRQVAGVAWD